MIEGKLREILGMLNIEILSKSGTGWLWARCPFAPYLHAGQQDRNPSFNVKIEPGGRSGFNCFTCHASGSIAHLVRQLAYYRDTSYRVAENKAMLYEIPGDFGDFEAQEASEEPLVPIPEELHTGMFNFLREKKKARQYLLGRRMKLKAARTLGCMFDDTAEQRIVFPVRDLEGTLYGYTGRTILPESQWPQGKNFRKVRDYFGLKKEKLLLGEHLVDPRLPFLVVEGLMALLHVVGCGARQYCNPVATMGSSLSLHQRDRLAAYDKPVYLLYDDDIAGDIGLYGLQDKEGVHKGGGAIDLLKEVVPTFLCYYPDGITDPDNLKPPHVKAMVRGKMKELCR